MHGSDFRLLYIFFTVLFLLLVFGIRYLRNRENMALIERGMVPPKSGLVNFNGVLVCALVFIGLGTGLFIGNMASKRFMSDSPVIAHFVFVSIFIGVGLAAAYLIELGRQKK